MDKKLEIKPIETINLEISSGKKPKGVVKIEDERLNFLLMFIGTNRTGKTSVAIEIMKKWKESRPEEYLIYCHDPQNKFAPTGLVDEFINPSNKMWAVDLFNSCKNCLVIIDDYKIINDKNIPVAGLSDLIYHRADNNVDIIFICHSPALVINFLTYFITHYYIFYTQSVYGTFQKKIPNYELCVGASKLVNDYVLKNGRGNYPNFPYILVDNEKGKLIAYNMVAKKEKK